MIDQIAAASKHRDVDYHSSSDNGDKKLQELKTTQNNKGQRPESALAYERDQDLLISSARQFLSVFEAIQKKGSETKYKNQHEKSNS